MNDFVELLNNNIFIIKCGNRIQICVLIDGRNVNEQSNECAKPVLKTIVLFHVPFYTDQIDASYQIQNIFLMEHSTQKYIGYIGYIGYNKII